MTDSTISLVVIFEPLSIVLLLVLLYCYRENLKLLTSTKTESKNNEFFRERARTAREAEERAREQPIYPRLFEEGNTQQDRSRSARYETAKVVVLTTRDADTIKNMLLEGLFCKFPHMPCQQAAGYLKALNEALIMDTTENMRIRDTTDDHNCGHGAGHDVLAEHRADSGSHRTQTLHRVNPLPDLQDVYQTDRNVLSGLSHTVSVGGTSQRHGSNETSRVNHANGTTRRARMRRSRAVVSQDADHGNVQSGYGSSVRVNGNENGLLSGVENDNTE